MWQVAAQTFTSCFRTFPRGRRAASARCGLETTHDAHCDGGAIDPGVGRSGRGAGGSATRHSGCQGLVIGPAEPEYGDRRPARGAARDWQGTAERILEYREKSGGFKKVEDLMNVKGIGEKSFLKLKPLITVSSAKAASGEQ